MTALSHRANSSVFQPIHGPGKYFCEPASYLAPASEVRGKTLPQTSGWETLA